MLRFIILLSWCCTSQTYGLKYQRWSNPYATMTVILLSVIPQCHYVVFHYAECHYAEFHYAEYHYTKVITWVFLNWVSVYRVLLRWVSFCWVSLWWVLLFRVLWFPNATHIFDTLPSLSWIRERVLFENISLLKWLKCEFVAPIWNSQNRFTTFPFLD